MNKIKKIVCLSIATLVCALSFGSCDLLGRSPSSSGSSSSETKTHVCESVCEECGKCTDTACMEENCKEKCEGHENVPVVKTYGVKIMSFNLDQAYGSDASKQQKVYDKIIDELPDLLGVQEETPAWQSYLEDKLDSEGYARVGEYRSTQPDHPYYAYREASAIYYNVDRFTLKESGTFWLSPTPDVEASVATDWSDEALFPRVCTWVVVTDKRSGEDLAYFNSHFSYEAEVLRTESAKLIVSRIQEKGIPAFFSGDLNFASNEEPATYAAITAEMEDSRIVAPETMTGNTFHNYGYGAGESYGSETTKTVPIDYIFATKGDFSALTFRILSETGDKGDADDYYSDHFSIVATYQYTKTL